jgi:hypothetical protein
VVAAARPRLVAAVHQPSARIVREILDAVPIDADPAVDGIQPNCLGTEIHFSATAFSERPLPPCAADRSAASARWRIAYDMTHCWRNGLGFEFLVDAPRPTCMPDDAVRYSLTCAVGYDHD